MNSCPCGSGQDFTRCCLQYLEGKAIPATPEELMRSRYTAYTKVNIDYIRKTMRGRAAIGFNLEDVTYWAKRATWIKLNIITTTLETPVKGFVEFVATFVDGHTLKSTGLTQNSVN